MFSQQLLGGFIAACFRGLFGFSIPAVAGIFSGATTNTPSLAAAQAVLQGFKGQSSENTDLLGMAYAVAYPFGIVGIILTMLLIRNVFRINPEAEAIAKDIEAESDDRTPDHIDLDVTNPNVNGLVLRDVPFALESGIVFSRLYSNGSVHVPDEDSV